MTRARDLSEIVNSTGLSVDTDTLVVDSANNRVGIGTSDPTTKLVVASSIARTDTVTPDTATVKIANNLNDGLAFGHYLSSPFGSWIQSGYLLDGYVPEWNQGYSISLNPQGGNVGIGTSVPSAVLDVNDTGATDNAWNTIAKFRPDLSDSNAESSIHIQSYPSTTVVADRKAGIQSIDDSGNARPLILNKDGGNVGIGTSSPSTGYKLHLAGDDTQMRIQHIGSGANGYLDLNVNSTVATINANYSSSAIDLRFLTASTERMRIDSVGTTTIKTDGSTQLVLNRADASIQNGNQIANLLVTGDDPSAGQSGAAISFTAGDAWATNSYPTNIIFSNDQSGTLAPRMTLDASGNLLVGTTSLAVSSSTGSVTGTVINNSGLFEAAKTGTVMELNRLTADGDILNFRRDGTTVGSIGVDNNDNFYIGATTSGHSGFYFGNTNVAPMAAGTKVDNTIDLGTSDNRFIDLHLSGGVVLDENPTIVGTTVVNRTITSKTLDDYEEGTWIPAIAGWTGTFVGTYTKTGNTVFYALSTGTLSGSGSDIIEITGLPFDPSASQASGTVMAQHVNTSTGTANLVGYTMGGSKLRIYETLDNAGWNALTESSLTSGSSQFIISGTYTTA